MSTAVTQWITLDITVSEVVKEIAMDHAISLGDCAVIEADNNFQVSYADDEGGHASITELKTFLREIDPEAHIGETLVQRENWNRKWQAYFKPVLVSDHMVILPEWEDPNTFSQEVRTRIKPAMAFGTGTHETTQLCLELLEIARPTEGKVLDIGTGSGILGITALHLGASSVDGIDIDPLVTENVMENVNLNQVAGKFKLQITNDPDLKEPYDLLMVNMIRSNLFPILPAYFKSVRKGGTAIVSGLLKTEENEFQELLAGSSWKVQAARTKNEWIAYICTVE